jgi:hypothetical protein
MAGGVNEGTKQGDFGERDQVSASRCDQQSVLRSTLTVNGMKTNAFHDSGEKPTILLSFHSSIFSRFYSHLAHKSQSILVRSVASLSLAQRAKGRVPIHGYRHRSSPFVAFWQGGWGSVKLSLNEDEPTSPARPSLRWFQHPVDSGMRINAEGRRGRCLWRDRFGRVPHQGRSTKDLIWPLHDAARRVGLDSDLDVHGLFPDPA